MLLSEKNQPIKKKKNKRVSLDVGYQAEFPAVVTVPIPPPVDTSVKEMHND